MSSIQPTVSSANRNSNRFFGEVDGLRKGAKSLVTQIYISVPPFKVTKVDSEESVITISPIDRSQLDAFRDKIKAAHAIEAETTESEIIANDYAGLTFQTKKQPTQSNLLEVERLVQAKKVAKPALREEKTEASYFNFVGYSFAALSMIFIVFASAAIALKSNMGIVDSSNKTAVADQVEAQNEIDQEVLRYKAWIQSKMGGLDPGYNEDSDVDGLSNYEEFLIGSNPNSPYSCNPRISDTENLANLINPANCKAINLQNSLEANVFYKIIPTLNFGQNTNQLELILQSSSAASSSSQSSSSSSSSESKKEDIPPSSLSISSSSQSSLTVVAPIAQNSPLVTDLVPKISSYINRYSSYDNFDASGSSPVSPEYYLEVSQKYNVPIKYVLAVGRMESRFGTDQYDQYGNLNRIGANKNIYSIGLDDAGNNVAFGSWEQGVDAFGRWYKKFNDRGVTDCNKWRIYNPNGDYCQKVEAVANEVDYFLKTG
jgi:hypothetical protein